MGKAHDEHSVEDERTSEDSRSPKGVGSALIDKFPQWFAVAIALIYGTGFLVVSYLADYIGFRGAVVEGLKATYIHIGILCLQFPISIGIIVLATMFLSTMDTNAEGRKAQTGVAAATKGDHKVRLSRKEVLEAWAMPAFSMVMLLFFYMLSTFARPGHFAAHEEGCALFFLITVVGALIMAWQRGLFWRNWRFQKKILDPYSVKIRWYLVGVLLIVTGVVFASTWQLVWEMLMLGGYMYFLLVFLIGEILWRLKGRYDNDHAAGLLPAYAVTGLTVCAALFYLATVTVADRVYPYIPVAKGGKDYTDEPKRILWFDEKYKNSIPAECIAPQSKGQESLRSIPLIVIEETDNNVFIAKVTTASNPGTWRKPGRAGKPLIATIKRDAIASVQDP